MEFDKTLRIGLSAILNAEVSDHQWNQASLPVKDGGLGIRSAVLLAPSAFLASAAGTTNLQGCILPMTIAIIPDSSIQSSFGSFGLSQLLRLALLHTYSGTRMLFVPRT